MAHAPIQSRQKKPNGFRPAPSRPVRRRVAKATIISPEARREAEERNRRMIEEFIASGRVQKCDPMWADGAVPMTSFPER